MRGPLSVALAVALCAWGPDLGASPPDEDAIFGGQDADEPGFADPEPELRREEDPLTIGGQVYLRLSSSFSDRGSAAEQPLSMPNLVDLYLDARPDPRVRAFFNGRLRYDPTVSAEATDLFGQPVEPASVSVDQLWLKTDIARAVFVTLGQAPLKWGASRLWNPTDFVNQSQRPPLSLFDERSGVPMVKLHVPIESLGWNVYGLLLLDDVDRVEDVGGALRLEMVVDKTEFTLSSKFGKERKTSFGADFSAGVGEVDIFGELSLTDERDTLVYSGDFSLDPLQLPVARPRDDWVARGSVGLQYTFKPNDDDLMVLGVEYFYNPLGTDNTKLYPWLVLAGDFQPFYLGEHYAALFWLVPSPGSWDDVSFGLSAVGNLSDESFVTRLDVSATLHTRLRLEGYAQFHYGQRGGEFRFELDVPDIPAVEGLLDQPIAGFSIAPPIVLLGLNLRLAI